MRSLDTFSYDLWVSWVFVMMTRRDGCNIRGLTQQRHWFETWWMLIHQNYRCDTSLRKGLEYSLIETLCSSSFVGSPIAVTGCFPYVTLHIYIYKSL